LNKKDWFSTDYHLSSTQGNLRSITDKECTSKEPVKIMVKDVEGQDDPWCNFYRSRLGEAHYILL